MLSASRPMALDVILRTSQISLPFCSPRWTLILNPRTIEFPIAAADPSIRACGYERRLIKRYPCVAFLRNRRLAQHATAVSCSIKHALPTDHPFVPTKTAESESSSRGFELSPQPALVKMLI
jgi:hypothetical protein